MLARFNCDLEGLERLDRTNAQRAANGFDAPVERSRNPQVVLRAVDDDDDSRIEHIHIAIRAHRDLDGHPPVA